MVEMLFQYSGYSAVINFAELNNDYECCVQVIIVTALCFMVCLIGDESFPGSSCCHQLE